VAPKLSLGFLTIASPAIFLALLFGIWTAAPAKILL
jgi:hypothetical protein